MRKYSLVGVAILATVASVRCGRPVPVDAVEPRGFLGAWESTCGPVAGQFERLTVTYGRDTLQWVISQHRKATCDDAPVRAVRGTRSGYYRKGSGMNEYVFHTTGGHEAGDTAAIRFTDRRALVPALDDGEAYVHVFVSPVDEVTHTVRSVHGVAGIRLRRPASAR